MSLDFVADPAELAVAVVQGEVLVEAAQHPREVLLLLASLLFGVGSGARSASKSGSDSLLMIFAGDLGFSNGESTPCELAFKFRHLCLVGWRLTV